MKATMAENGMITLEAETSVEAYALRRWMEDAYVQQKDVLRAAEGHWRESMLMVKAEVPK